MRANRSLICALAFALLTSVAMGTIAAAEPDDIFLGRLESATAETPLDTPRFIQFLDSIRQTLWTARGGVRRLQAAIDGGADRGIRESLRRQYASHEAALARMQIDLPRLQQAPDDAALLFDLLRAGEEACWHLNRYRRVAESYGALPEYQVAVVPAAEACRQLSRAAFSAPVAAFFGSRLAEDRQRQETLHELREEIAALEELFEDLQEIDAR